MTDIDVKDAAITLLNAIEGVLEGDDDDDDDIDTESEPYTIPLKQSAPGFRDNNNSRYIRIGIKIHDPNQGSDDIQYIGIIVACVDLTTSAIEFLYTDAFTVSGVQYGHYNIGDLFDIHRGTWVPDSRFSGIQRPDLEDILEGIADGSIITYEVKFPEAEDEDSKDFPLVALPMKPDYMPTGQPSVSGHFASEAAIPSTIFPRNMTNVHINLDELINLSYIFYADTILDKFERFLIYSSNDKKVRKRFKGLKNMLSSKLGTYRDDWDIDVFVLPQIPNSHTLCSWTENDGWTAGQWLSSRPEQGFKRQLYIEVHIVPKGRKEDEDKMRSKRGEIEQGLDELE